MGFQTFYLDATGLQQSGYGNFNRFCRSLRKIEAIRNFFQTEARMPNPVIPSLAQPVSKTPLAAASKPLPEDPLRKAAIDLEASFLAEMLKSAGLGESREGFGGGAGEDQFSSFLVRAQAEQIAKAGGIGLAESLYHALKESQNDQP